MASLPDAEIVVVLRELAARRRVLDAALVEVAGELLRREDESPRAETVARKSGFRNLAAMVEQVLAVKPFEAKTLVQLAEATRERMSATGESILPRYAEVSKAVGSGVMSVAQAAAITKGLDRTGNRVDVDELARGEIELVASACGLNPEDEQPAVPKVLEVQAATWVSYLDPDGDEPRADKIAEERGLWFTRRADGAVSGKFVATPEQGEQLLSVFDALLSPRRAVEFPAASECGEPLAPALGADELPFGAGRSDGTCAAHDDAPGGDNNDDSDDGAGCARGLADGDDGDNHSDVGEDEIVDVPLVDPRSIEQQRIDALTMILRAYAESPDAPRTGGEAPTVIIVTTTAGQDGTATRPEDLPHLERTGEPVPPSVAAQIMCDGLIRIAITDTNGEILDLGRKQRLFTTAQRRAIATRDRQCRAPGCSAPVRWCEVHHAIPWSEGGPTDAKDGILLCSFHHHEVHRERLTLTRSSNGRWHVVPALGRHVPPRASRRRGYPPPAANSRAANSRAANSRAANSPAATRSQVNRRP
ncbi:MULTISPECIES: HNH endonuclease signature motif containing protein [unclassified Pseudoclavibacter]|uniref:HNH endonuclease signature motif containing protein n=1 Tax=unclassified Pseudoclavibacter TaxID=2615177 RepID=UPI0015E3719A|nr:MULTISPECIES: HNH endonuclease signature motif containing protein [unclassified Pseudoclavibacter]